MIKALFFDIDGTLVSFDTHRIPASTIDAIAEARANGVQVFISTGRSQVIINNLSDLQERGLIDGYVTMNGAYCFVGDHVIYKDSIPAEDVERLTAFCEEHSFPCIVVGEHDICVFCCDDTVRYIFNDCLKVDVLAEKSREEAIRDKEVFQLTPFITEEQEHLILPQLKRCETGRWHPAFADITAVGNTKEKGIAEMLKHIGLQPEEIMAFGDGGNDIPMLRYAGIGVAMGNANDTVKASADYVTTSVDEDGVANALKHFGIIGRR